VLFKKPQKIDRDFLMGYKKFAEFWENLKKRNSEKKAEQEES
jgi:hypothetical protein